MLMTPLLAFVLIGWDHRTLTSYRLRGRAVDGHER
jgi:hypothetical protein